MKLFFNEFKADYGKYYFPYQVWLLKEQDDDPELIYKDGFLPIRSVADVYYLSRSLRVDLNRFEPSSENRRIMKKTENFSSKMIPLSEFDYNPSVQKMCSDYADDKFGKDVLPTAAIRAIFKNGVYNHVIIFTEKLSSKEVGYAVCYLADNFIQYAFSFYDLSFLKDNLGARMMLEAVILAKEMNKKFIYLGSCYSKESLYKTEFQGIEFFNGFGWSLNLDELKFLIDRDKPEYLLKDKDYLDTFFEGHKETLLKEKGIRINFIDE